MLDQAHLWLPAGGSGWAAEEAELPLTDGELMCNCSWGLSSTQTPLWEETL